MEHLRSYFIKNPIIAGVRDEKSFSLALNSKVIALFILHESLLNLESMMKKARDYDKLIFLHLDLIQGIAQDKAGIDYLAYNNLCDGILTTKSNLIQVAKKNDLIAIQRLFMLDSASLRTGKKLIKNNQPDAVEILPAIAAPYFIEHSGNTCPIIAGGLIREKREVIEIVNKGVLAVSSSDSQLWNW